MPKPSLPKNGSDTIQPIDEMGVRGFPSFPDVISPRVNVIVWL